MKYKVVVNSLGTLVKVVKWMPRRSAEIEDRGYEFNPR